MIQVITHCDRCNKLVGEKEGSGFQVWSRTPVQIAPGIFHNAVPVTGDLCEGCREMLEFYFSGKFKEVPSAQV